MAAARVSIPAGARRMIQNIKEIAGGHADEEVYAVLRECDMDPNEAAQRLLSRGSELTSSSISYLSHSPEFFSSLASGSITASRTFHEVKRKRDKKKESGKESADPRLRPGVHGRDVKGGQGSYSLHLNGRKPLSGKEVGVNQNMDKGKGNGILVNQNMESMTSTSSSCLSGGLSNGPSQHVAPIEKNYPDAGHLLTSDSKRSVDLEDAEAVTTSVLDVSQSIKPHISAVDPMPSLSLEARFHGEICSTDHDLKNQPTAGILQAWNPKSTSKPTQAENVMFEDVAIRVGTVTLSVPVLSSALKEDHSLKVDKRLTEMQLSDKQHVIIPDHLQVTESEKYGLSFGSFGTSFGQTAPQGPECEKSSTLPEDDSSQELHEVICEPSISSQGASSSINVETHKDLRQLSVDDSSRQRVYGSSETTEVARSELAKDSSAASHVLQDSISQTTKNDYQTQVPQANGISECYHTQPYQPIADVDGRISPFAAPVAPIKYGNIPVSHAQTGEAQEGINLNSFVVPSPVSAPFVPAASGAAPTSIAIPQPPNPLFRQPVGVHLPHYAPSFIPYNHYISPFYYPPHTLNHFMGNAAVFPQSPSTGSMYPPVSASVAPPVKYSSSTYKTGDNTGSQTHVGIPGAYAVYGSSPSVYTNNAAVMNGASVETDDVIGSQFKESNIFVAGQQSDGSTVWIPAPGQDVSSLQSTPFGVLPSQGQHLAFVPAQAGHGAFRGMYHPAQTVGGPAFHPLQSSQTTAGAVEAVVGPPNSGYQQPQHAQMNWGSY